jgi:hypothetical protein
MLSGTFTLKIIHRLLLLCWSILKNLGAFNLWVKVAVKARQSDFVIAWARQPKNSIVSPVRVYVYSITPCRYLEPYLLKYHVDNAILVQGRARKDSEEDAKKIEDS